MKKPDKIYVSIRDLQYGYTTDVCLSQEEGYSAYIRKEALLEWANKDLCPTAYLQLKNKLEEM